MELKFGAQKVLEVLYMAMPWQYNIFGHPWQTQLYLRCWGGITQSIRSFYIFIVARNGTDSCLPFCLSHCLILYALQRSRQRTTKKKMKVDKTNEMSYRDLNIRRLYLGEEPFRDGGHQGFDVPASKRPKSWNLHVQLNISFTIRYVTFTSREFWDY